MKYGRKMIAFVLVLLLCMLNLAMPAKAMNTVWQYGDWTYGITNSTGKMTIIKYSGSAKDLTVPTIIDKRPIGEIAMNAFSGCNSLQSVVVPEGIKVNQGLFYGLTNLQSVQLPDMQELPSQIFYGCTSLTYAPIPYSVLAIGAEAYANCTSLTSVTLPANLEEIYRGAFSGCTGLTSVYIPAGVMDIYPTAFSGCENLTAIWVDPNNPYYNTDAYGVVYSEDWSKLVFAPGGLSGTYAIPQGVREIGMYAFMDCKHLEGIVIPDTVTSIGPDAFNNCTALRFMESYSYQSVSAQNCTALESVILAAGNIAPYAFSGCSNLREVTLLSEDLFMVGDNAFQGVTATIHYQEKSPNWTADKNRPYGGNLTWVPAHDYKNGTCTVCGLEEPPFEDVLHGMYYYDPVKWAVKENITTGTSATTFAPDATCTRAQIVTFLWRANGSPAPTSGENPFTDVPADQWYTDAVLWAVEEGITSGMTETTFAPDAACTRGQVATFLYRSQDKPASDGKNIFTDIVSGAYYYDAVLWAVENGITNGMGDGTFAPDAPCTRGQIVTFLFRAMA